MRGITQFIFTAAIATFTTMAQAQNGDVLMTIGSEKVSKAEFEYVYKKNNKNVAETDEKSLRDYLTLYTNFKLKVIEAKSLGMDTVSSFKKELAGYRKQLAQPYLTDKEVNERLIKEAYDRLKIEVRASQLLINCAEDASPKDTLAAYNKIMNLRARIVDKKEPFAKVAKTYSQDPSAATNAGDLGYFSAFDMVYPFENVAYTTAKGSVSMPVRTRFGYHIIQVTDIRPAQGEVRVAHIMIKATDKMSKQDSLNTAAKMQEIYNRLQNGEKFEDLVRQFSEDKASAKSGGALPMFKTGKMVLEFETEAYALKNVGDYSKPFTTIYGWHIVKLLEKKAPATYEESSRELKNRVARDSRSDLNKTSFVAKLKVTYGFKENPAALKKFNDKLDKDSAIQKLNFKKEQVVNPNDQLFSIEGKVFLVSDYANYFQINYANFQKDKPSKLKKDLYEAYVSKTLMDYEEERLDSKYPEFKALMQEYRDGILLFELTDQKVWSAAVKDTAGLEAFFKANEAKYMWTERLDATIYTCANEETAVAVRALLKNKKISQDSLLRRINKSNPLNLTIKTDKFERGDKSLIDEIEWKKGITDNQTVGNTIVFVRVNEKIAAQPKKLNEIRGIVTADYQTQLEKTWVDGLKQKYQVSIDETVFKSMIK